jgi:DNA-binding response OmpR family regulator
MAARAYRRPCARQEHFAAGCAANRRRATFAVCRRLTLCSRSPAKLTRVTLEQGTIVVVEDDPNIADLLDLYLRREGFRVLQAGDGESGVATIERDRPRLAIVDIGLPGAIDGLEVCRRIRAGGPLPVLILSARDAEIDRIVGLELGADDYMTKPFSPRELVARVRAILRRTEGPPPERPRVINVGEVTLDLGRREVRLGSEAVALATREFDLLAYLVDNLGLALTRQQLLDGVWGPDWYGDERTVDVHVRQLRKKLGDALPLHTVWGVGYRLG